MRVSGIAIKQRETEAKALRLFVASSLIGSLVLHVGLLASGVLSMNVQTPEAENEPIELTFIDPPVQEEIKEPPKPERPKPEPPKPEPQQLEKIEPPIPEPETITNSLSDPGGSSASSALPQISEFKPQIPQKPIVPETPPRKIPQVLKPKVEPKVEQIEPPKPIQPPPQVTKAPEKPIQPPPQVTKVPEKPIQAPPQIAKAPEKPVPQSQPTQEANEDLKRLLEQQKSESRTQREFSVPQTPIQEPQPTQKTNDDLKRLLAQQQSKSRTQREFSPAPAPTQSSPSDTSNSSPKIAAGNDTSPRRRRRDLGSNNEVATAPTTPNPGTGSGTGDSIGDGDGRAACRRCRTSYPSWAKRKGIEGKIVVALNTDPQGNVTKVELLNSSSGNSKFDKEHLKLARKWKLKPSSNGRQGVKIITNYVLE